MHERGVRPSQAPASTPRSGAAGIVRLTVESPSPTQLKVSNGPPVTSRCPLSYRSRHHHTVHRRGTEILRNLRLRRRGRKDGRFRRGNQRSCRSQMNRSARRHKRPVCSRSFRQGKSSLTVHACASFGPAEHNMGSRTGICRADDLLRKCSLRNSRTERRSSRSRRRHRGARSDTRCAGALRVVQATEAAEASPELQTR